MISKLPRWLWVFGWVLAFNAGFINVIGLLGFSHQTVTHLTGITSLFAVEVAHQNLDGIRHFGGIFLSFMAGCLMSGLLIPDSALKLGNRYFVALSLEAALLGLSIPLMWRSNALGIFLACGACGLQNAMVSTYSGTVIRTTHLSGMFTDLGIFLGHWLRGTAVNQRRLLLCLAIISGFFAGSLVSALSFSRFRYDALCLPVLIASFSAILCAFVRHRASAQSFCD